MHVLSSSTAFNDIINNPIISNLLSSILFAIIAGIFVIIFKNPYIDYRLIRLKILKIIREYIDPRNCSMSQLRIIETQLNAIKEVDDKIQEQKVLRPLFSKFVSYDTMQIDLRILFEYIQDPIMLVNHKHNAEDYRMDTDKLFKNLKKIILFIWLKFMIVVALIIVITFTVTNLLK